MEDAEELTFVKLVPSPGLSAVHIIPPFTHINCSQVIQVPTPADA